MNRSENATTGPALVLGSAALLALVAVSLNLAIGPVRVPLGDVFSALGSVFSDAESGFNTNVVLNLRGPRAVLAILVGAALAVSGAAFQGLFRNPLADPSLIGISAGAATGAVAFIVVGSGLPLFDTIPSSYALPLAAAVGAVIAAVGIHALARRAGHIDVPTLLLAGIAINALCSSLSGILIFASDDQQLRELTYWSMGSLARAHWATIVPALPWLVLATGGLMAMSRGVNALALGEAEAGYLGYRVERLKTLIVLAVAIAVGVAVAMSGIIAFVGLIVPHIMRLLVGADNRYVFAGAALVGAALMLLADLIARMAVVPAELPIGVLTSLAGAPFFLWLMGRSRTFR